MYVSRDRKLNVGAFEKGKDKIGKNHSVEPLVSKTYDKSHRNTCSDAEVAQKASREML